MAIFYQYGSGIGTSGPTKQKEKETKPEVERPTDWATGQSISPSPSPPSYKKPIEEILPYSKKEEEKEKVPSEFPGIPEEERKSMRELESKVPKEARNVQFYSTPSGFTAEYYSDPYSKEFMKGTGATPSDVKQVVSDVSRSEIPISSPAVGSVSYVQTETGGYLSITPQEQVKAEKAYQEYKQLPDRPTWTDAGPFISGLTESSLVSGKPGAYVSPKGAKAAEAVLLTSSGKSVIVSSLLEVSGKKEKGTTEDYFRRAISETATTGMERVSSFAQSPVGIAATSYFAGMGYGTARAAIGTYVVPAAASWTAPLFTASEYALGGAMTLSAVKSVYDPLKEGDIQTAGERTFSTSLGFAGFYAGYKSVQQPKFYDVEYLEGVKRTEKRLKRIGDVGDVAAKTVEGQVEPVRTEYTLRDILSFKKESQVSYTKEYTDPFTGLSGVKGESVKYDLYTRMGKQVGKPDIPDIISLTGSRKKTYIAAVATGKYGEVVGLAKGETAVDILSPIESVKIIDIKGFGKKGTASLSLKGGQRPSIVEIYEIPSMTEIPIGSMEVGPVFGGKPLFVPVSETKSKSVSIPSVSIDVSVDRIKKSTGYVSESIIGSRERVSTPIPLFGSYMDVESGFESVPISSKASESVQELVKVSTFDVPETPSRDIPTDIMKPPGGMGFAIPPINWGASLFSARMKKSKEKRRFKYQPTVTGIAKSMTTGEFAKKVKKEVGVGILGLKPRLPLKTKRKPLGKRKLPGVPKTIFGRSGIMKSGKLIRPIRKKKGKK